MRLLLYCTKAKNKYDRLVSDEHYGKPFYLYGAITENFESLNGKIVAECDFEVEEIRPFFHWCKVLENKTCLSQEEVLNYLDSKDKSVGNPKRQDIVKLIHIKNLNIFDKPRELSDYYMEFYVNDYKKKGYDWKRLDKAPQNMMYCYEQNGDYTWERETYILISVHPEWLVKILNGEKQIEIRKKVLKEMLENDK